MSTTVQTVRHIDVGQLRYQPLDAQKIQERLKLFTTDQVETPLAQAATGVRVMLPVFEPESRSELRTALQNATPEQQAQVIEAGNQLYQALAAHSDGLSTTKLASNGMPGPVTSTFTSSTQAYSQATGTADPYDAMLGVFNVAVSGAESDVRNLAEQLQANTDAKAAVRDEMKDVRTDIAELKAELADWQPPDSKKTFTITDENGNPKEVELTKEEAQNMVTTLENRLETLEEKLATLGDMTQMQQFELQKAAEQMNLIFQTMSNLLKSQHETLKAIANNCRA
jgi:DNA-binding transcriptional MerR regulator